MYISRAPLTDHCLLYLDLKPKTRIIKRNGNFSILKGRQISIQFNLGKKRSKEIKDRELRLVQDIDECCKTSASETDRATLRNLQSKLYLKRPHGAFVRSRAKCLIEGEENTAYFCHSEKKTIREEGG